METSNPDPRLYMRIAAEIRDRITAGTLAPGSRVPSITELTEDRCISRTTGGKALQLLEDEGLICRVPGMGYHVTGQQPSGTTARTWRCSCGELFDGIPALEDHLFAFPEEEQHWEVAQDAPWPLPAPLLAQLAP